MKILKSLLLYIVTVPLLLGLVILLQRYVSPFFQDKVEKTEISLSSLVCERCVERVQSALSSLSGVIQADVLLEQRKAFVLFDESKTNVGNIEEAITAAGYDANDRKADLDAYDRLAECCKNKSEYQESEPGNSKVPHSNSCSRGCSKIKRLNLQ